MCDEVSTKYCCYMTFWLIIIFITSLLNLIFAITIPKGGAFSRSKYYNNYENYKKAKTFNFLYDFNFAEEIQSNDAYSSSLSIKKKYIEGTCNLNLTKYPSLNCSEACVDDLKECYYKEDKCDSFQCNEYSNDGSDRIYVEYNKINKWRNTEMYKYYESYEVQPYFQIKPKNGKCQTGYRKCAKINEDEDFLCLDEDVFEFKCPINNIVVKWDNIPPNDGCKYTSFKMGDKYIFYTNEKSNNYIIKDFYITFDDDKYDYNNWKLTDRDLYTNFTKFNKISFDRSSEKPQFASLNAIKLNLNYSYNEIIKSQKKYEKMKIFSNEKIDEMNSKVKQYKNILMVFGIVNLSIVVFYLVFVLPIYHGGCQDGTRCEADCKCELECCVDITPMKRVFHHYIFFAPHIGFSFVGFIMTFIKFIAYMDYSSMDYIEEVEVDDDFEISNLYNTIQFICYSINIVIIILFPILVKKTDK